MERSNCKSHRQHLTLPYGRSTLLILAFSFLTHLSIRQPHRSLAWLYKSTTFHPRSFLAHLRFLPRSQSDCACLLPSGPLSLPNPPQHLFNMGMSYRRYLAGARVYGCQTCRTHLTTIHSMISRVSVAYHSLCDRLNDPSAGIQRPARTCLLIRRCVRSDGGTIMSCRC